MNNSDINSLLMRLLDVLDGPPKSWIPLWARRVQCETRHTWTTLRFRLGF